MINIKIINSIKKYRDVYYDGYDGYDGYEVLTKEGVTDGYGNLVDGYDNFGFVDGYEFTINVDDSKEETFFIRLEGAWKYRRLLYKLNMSIKDIQDGYGSGEMLNFLLTKRDHVKSLCSTMDGRSKDDERYTKVPEKNDIGL